MESGGVVTSSPITVIKEKDELMSEDDLHSDADSSSVVMDFKDVGTPSAVKNDGGNVSVSDYHDNITSKNANSHNGDVTPSTVSAINSNNAGDDVSADDNYDDDDSHAAIDSTHIHSSVIDSDDDQDQDNDDDDDDDQDQDQDENERSDDRSDSAILIRSGKDKEIGNGNGNGKDAVQLLQLKDKESVSSHANALTLLQSESELLDKPNLNKDQQLDNNEETVTTSSPVVPIQPVSEKSHSSDHESEPSLSNPVGQLKPNSYKTLNQSPELLSGGADGQKSNQDLLTLQQFLMNSKEKQDENMTDLAVEENSLRNSSQNINYQRDITLDKIKSNGNSISREKLIVIPPTESSKSPINLHSDDDYHTVGGRASSNQNANQKQLNMMSTIPPRQQQQQQQQHQQGVPNVPNTSGRGRKRSQSADEKVLKASAGIIFPQHPGQVAVNKSSDKLFMQHLPQQQQMSHQLLEQHIQLQQQQQQLQIQQHQHQESHQDASSSRLSQQQYHRQQQQLQQQLQSRSSGAQNILAEDIMQTKKRRTHELTRQLIDSTQPLDNPLSNSPFSLSIQLRELLIKVERLEREREIIISENKKLKKEISELETLGQRATSTIGQLMDDTTKLKLSREILANRNYLLQQTSNVIQNQLKTLLSCCGTTTQPNR